MTNEVKRRHTNDADNIGPIDLGLFWIMEEGAKYAVIQHHVFRIDSATRFEATQILLKAQFMDEAETIRAN